jgi:hypothetical protein
MGLTDRVTRAMTSDGAFRVIAAITTDTAIEAAQAWKGATGGEVVGFVSHVDTATIDRARAAGIDRVLARSRFVELLPQLLVGETSAADRASE